MVSFIIGILLSFFVDWFYAQLGVWVASKAFGFETNVWMVVLVVMVMGLIEWFIDKLRKKE